MSNFYPRSPCGERRLNLPSKPIDKNISIHALLAESDRLCTILYSCPGNFYPRSPCGERRSNRPVTMHTWRFLSTLSLRRATLKEQEVRCKLLISIHALLAESDTAFCMDCQKSIYFYPRSPCGERQKINIVNIKDNRFLSTLSLRRATIY